MKCFKCGADLSSEAEYCSECGEYQGFSEELINQAKAGDQNAISDLYKRTYNNVYFTVKALIKSEDTVLDIVQDTYVRGFKSLSQLKEPDKFRAWIKRIAHNKAVDYLRKTKPVVFSSISMDDDEAVEFEDDRPDSLPEVMLDKKETARMIREILDSLSEEQRLAVGMYYYEQMSVREIADSLGVSENTVKSRLSYGRKKIEFQVRELEKKGTKLYSLAPIPFLLLLFRNADVQAAEIPDPGILQVIQKECSSGAMEKPGHSKPSQPGAGVKTAAGAASRVTAAKIAAGIAAAAVIGGGAVAAAKLSQKENSAAAARKPAEETADPWKSEAPENLSPEEIYQPVLNEYGTVMAKGSYEDEVRKNINYVMMDYYYQYGGYNAGIYTGFYYDYYDIDGNGTAELLIGYGSDDISIVDLYGIEAGEAYRLIDDDSLGERSQVSIYPDGRLVFMGSGGADSLQIDVYSFRENGVLNEPETILDANTSISGLGTGIDQFVEEKMNHQQPATDFDWKLIDPVWKAEKTADPIRYLGIYINGQDWNAGTLTIEENDSESVKVRMEAFKNRSDQNLSTIFEGIGYAAADGLIVDVSGRQVKLSEGTMGLVLEAAPSLREEWGLDDYTLDNEYLFTGLPAEYYSDNQTEAADITEYDGYCYYDGNHMRYRLDTADGNLTLMFYARSGSPEYYENPQHMNLDTAAVSGNVYTIYDVTDMDGNDISFKYFSIQFIFQENRVLMVVSADPSRAAGGAGDNVQNGTYELTRS